MFLFVKLHCDAINSLEKESGVVQWTLAVEHLWEADLVFGKGPVGLEAAGWKGQDAVQVCSE